MDVLHASILVVDDEKAIRTLCERALPGYRVFQAENCDEALRVYEQENIDLVLTDVMMPGECGLHLLSKIKQRDPNSLVIIMTSFSDKDTILTSLKEGADDFVSKPFVPLQVQNAVEKALCKKKLRGELADLKKLDQLKSNFLSIISHKLRTPITSISLFLQNMDSDIEGPKAEYVRHNARLMYDEAAYLERLVTDLLLFSQVMGDGGGLNFQKSNLVAMLGEALQVSAEAQRKTRVETVFVRTVLPEINLDRQKISFAIQQIIDNAYKFSGETGRITVCFEQLGDRVLVVVSDTGVGIPASDLAKVTDKFYQIDPDNTGQVRGFGLGLFYAREFIKQHGGTLTIESELGQGTAVTIMLPLQ
ncbi:MAG: response regulator [Desulfuromonadales bacterium]|nr:response regulator [Desulfuromonadales bacterium]